MGGKADTPEVPDYAKLLREQTAINRTDFQQQTAANRVNTAGPTGSSTWANNRTFDDAGYGQALAEYQNRMKTFDQSHGFDPNGPETREQFYAERGWNRGENLPSNYPGQAPNRDDFFRDAWTQKTEMSPEQRAVYDQQTAGNSEAQSLARTLTQQVAGMSPLNTEKNFSGLDRTVQGLNQRVAGPNYNAGVFDQSFKAAMDRYAAINDPANAKATSQLQDRLVQSGFSLGDTAAGSALRDQTLAQGADRTNTIESAIRSASALQDSEFGRGLQSAQFDQSELQRMTGLEQSELSRLQGLARDRAAAQVQDRTTPLTMAGSLRTGTGAILPNGQQTGPGMAGQTEAVDAVGTATQGYNEQLGAVNANNARVSGNYQAAGQTALAAILAMY